MIGTLSVLNVAKGDFEIRFDGAQPAEVEKAGKIVNDLLRRGYAIFIHEGETTKKVLSFDPAQCCYIVPDLDSILSEAPAKGKGKAKAAKATKAVPAAQAEAVAVAPVAGG